MSYFNFNVSNNDCLSQRWDLGGIVSEKSKNVTTSYNTYQVKKKATLSRNINTQVGGALICLKETHDIPLLAVSLFVWHKVLGVFGFTKQTAILTLAENASDTNETQLLRHFLDQKISSEESFIDTLKNITTWLNSYTNDQLKNAQHYTEPCNSVLLFTEATPSELKHKVPLLALVDAQNMGTITWAVSYDQALFDDTKIADMLNLTEVILEQVANHSEVSDSELELLNEKQKKQFQEWNNTDGDFPTDKTIHNLIEEAAYRTPDKEAIVFEEKFVTYRMLNERSNQIARWLIERQEEVKPQEIVALFLDANELLIFAVLGIWKSGAAYVPIDPNFPDERIRFILEDTGVTQLITHSQYTQKLSLLSSARKNVDIIDFDGLVKQLAMQSRLSGDNVELDLTSEGPAYITYTSGTTGIPKGVLKNHKSVVNSITDLSEKYNIGNEQAESIVIFSPYVFEPFVRQLLIALINNQRLVIVDDDEKLDSHRFPQFIKKHNITYLNGTASVLQQYNFSQCPSLRRLLLVGEELTPARYKLIRNVFKHKIINEYAFTESAFVTAIKEFDEHAVRDSRSIGRALRNVKCYVLNEYFQQVPVGTVGELFIGGAGVANGYFNRSELTKERFFLNPYCTENELKLGINKRLFRSGDLARVRSNGEIEFLGRNDFQIKLNGIRIEPGEIESVAVKYPNVKSCVVVLKQLKKESDNNVKYLIGYFVSDNPNVLEDELMRYLEKQLPRYMLPARMVRVEKIPVNFNGKVDLNTLPDITELTAGHYKVPPRRFSDEVLGRIWADILALPIQDIGITDDFFRLGGSSITCIILIAKIRKQFHIILTIDDIFQLKTIQQLSDKIVDKRADDVEEHTRVKTSSEKKTKSFSLDLLQAKQEVYLANSLQQGFMYQYLKKRELGTNDDYLMQSVFTYQASISSEKFKIAWEYIQNKYGCLRARFHWKEEPLQTIEIEQALDWQEIDLSDIQDIRCQNEAICCIQEQDTKKSYKLDIENPFRIYLIKQNNLLSTCLFSCHHIILDGWSLAILFNDFHNAYVTLMMGGKLNYTQDMTYEKALIFLQENRNEHGEYWSKKIEEITERGDYNGLVKQDKRYKVSLSEYDHVQCQKGKTLEIHVKDAAEIRNVCIQNSITLHSLLQFIWHKVLHTVGNASKTVVGTIVSGRNLPIDNIEQAVGLFINTLPLIVDHTENQNETALEVITKIQSQVNEMNSFSNVELGQAYKGDMKKQLFDTLFVLENYPDLGTSALRQQGIDFEANYELEKVDYPLAVIARETLEGSINFTLWYAAELFEDSIIDMLLDLVKKIYQQLIVDSSKRIDAFTLLSDSQRQLLDSWNETKTAFAEQQTLQQKFEDVVDRCAEKIALVYESTILTYRELNRLSNQLAYKIRSHFNIQPDNLIALILDKNEHMFISIFGVWKSGAAYVPIDPATPEDRIRIILEDTQTKLIITNCQYVKTLHNLVSENSQILAIDQLCLDKMPDSNPELISCSTDLAYVMFTSGTTGRPKGVMVEHRGVLNLQVSLANIFNLGGEQEESFLSFSNYIFDHFVEQMIDALLNGQKLVVLNEQMRTDKARLYRYMFENNVTYLSGTPSVLSMYEFDSLPNLRRIDAIGEDFTETLFNKIRGTFKGEIINGYGPTEVSITTHKRPYSTKDVRKNKSIGFPIANITVYILNEHMQRLPVGCVGEIYLGGVGVARGYLNREDLTRERFIANPFQTLLEKEQGQNARIYKTGDLGRWLLNGEVEYLGRTDTQVKIRGLRIELAEIEAALTACPGVKQAVVIARNRSVKKEVGAVQKYLIGFYLSEQQLSQDIVIEFVRKKLPEFMVPNQVIRIERVPVTASGKLDVKRLPETAFLTQSETYTPPSNEIEHKLCAIWSDILDFPTDKIGINDSFFSLGGDSILATRLAYTITQTMAKSVNVANIFYANTIAMQRKCLLDISDDVQDIATKLPNSNNVVSLAQERLLFINEFANGTYAYNIAIHLELPREVHKRQLIQSLQGVILRHSVLRTLISGETDGVRLQRVVPKMQAMDMLVLVEEVFEHQTDMDAALIKEEKHIFSLDKELPIRIFIFENKSNSQSLFLTLIIHHVCFDGWSWLVLQRDLRAWYDYCTGHNKPLNLPRLNLHYSEFASWQRERLAGEKLEKITKFWLEKLACYEPLNLITDLPRPVQFDYRGKEIEFFIDQSVTQNLRSLARQLNVSFYSILVGAYCLMLSHYTQQQDIVIGMPFANRNQVELKNMVGFFANLLVLRVSVDYNLPVIEYIKAVSDDIASVQIHQELTFEHLVKMLKVGNDPSQHPVVQVTFALDLLETQSHCDSIDASGLRMRRYKPYAQGETTAKYDLSGWMSETESGLSGNFTYASSLFFEQTIVNFTHHYKALLEHIAALLPTEQSYVADIPCINKDDEENLIDTQGCTRDYIDEDSLCLHELFEKEAAARPNNIAVVYENTELNYQQLNQCANKLAHYLRVEKGVRKGDFVALILDKSQWMIVSILAVWKAGAAYVPIAPNYPYERIKFMLSDTGAQTVLMNSKYCQHIARCKGVESIVEIDDEAFICNLEDFPHDNCNVPQCASSLAYVIYTSGTTGKPKGVQVAHSSVVNLRNDLQTRYFQRSNLGQETALLLANYVFDFSIEQLLVSIFCGNTLIVYSSDQSIEGFYAHANQHQLSFLSGTPTHIQQFDLSRFEYLKLLVVAGEVFTKNHYQNIRQQYQGTLVNAYGVTETSVYNIVKVFQQQDRFENSLGTALSNMKVYVLNERLELLPKGAVGELYLAGNCVSCGYLNQPALSGSCFIPNPFQSEEDKLAGRYPVLYKTGDLVRYLPNVELSYIGRNDMQVKIRGLRIELGEIESVLAAYPGIEHCVVTTFFHDGENGSEYLIAYFVDSNNVVNEDLLFDYLRERLPGYMVPKQLMRLICSIPMTINGKVDFAALPKAKLEKASKTIVAPRNAIEKSLLHLWMNLLKTDSLGIDNDFFKNGGDSISAMTLVSFIQRELRQLVRVKDIFDYPTIKTLYENVLKNRTFITECDAEQGLLTGTVPLLPIQRWFFNKQLHDRQCWNQSFGIKTPALDIEQLKLSIEQLLAYHDAFRLRFRKTQSGYEQYYGEGIHPVPFYTLYVADLSQYQIHEQLTQWQSNFDIHNAHTYCFAYLHGFDSGTSVVWLAAHHLIIDTVSWRILISDLQRLYDGGDLGNKGSSYRQWTQTVDNYNICEDELFYWDCVVKEIRKNPDEVVRDTDSDTGTQQLFILDASRTKHLLKDCHFAYDTNILDLLLTAFGMALSDVNNTTDHYVTLEAHGRESNDQRLDINSTMGWFTSMYPFPIHCKDNIKDSILAVKKARLSIPVNGIGYGAHYGYIDTPLPNISFNYLGRFSEDALSDGLWGLAQDFCSNLRHPKDKNASDCLTDVTVICNAEILSVTVDSRQDKHWLAHFTSAFKDHLESLIDHTMQIFDDKATALKRSNIIPFVERFDPYVEFNQSVEDSPVLFLLPPGEGGAESYFNNMVKYLTDFRLVVFNNVYLHGKITDATFESLANFYLEYVHSIQPCGPYHFLGWSFGGVLSLEMSRQLVDAGEKIGSLHFIDSYFNVKKACCDLQLDEDKSLIDIINYRYNPDSKSMERLVQAIDNIVLFKAMKINDTYSNDKQYCMYKYYQESELNNLETLLDPRKVLLQLMFGESHVSWVENKTLLTMMTDIVSANVLNHKAVKMAPSLQQLSPPQRIK